MPFLSCDAAEGLIPRTPLSAISENPPSMSSTTDEDDSSPDDSRTDTMITSAGNNSMTFPSSLHTPVLATTTSPMSPTSFTPINGGGGGGLYYRHNRSQAKDLEAARRALHLSLQSPTARTPSVSPQRRFRKSRKRVAAFLILLLAACMCASITLTFYLMNQMNQSQHENNNHGGKFHSKEQNEIMSVAAKLARDALTRNAAQQEEQEQKHNYKPSDLKPRIIYLEPNHGFVGIPKRRLADDPMLHAPPGQEAPPQDDYDPLTYHDEECVPMSDWQTASFPNCNMLHELNIQSAGQRIGKNHSHVSHEDRLGILGQGWFRHTWQVDLGSSNETVVLKTLRLEREFYGEFFELHRRDAVAMERLTFSPFVMDIYGFCGQSAVNEMASFGHSDITNLEKFDRRLRGKDTPQATFVKLQIATSVAVGVAHVHQVNGADERPAMVHYDLNPRNIAIVKGGKPKLNDFNIAEFLRVNPKTNETCKFPSRLHEPWWRAPEEVVLPKPGEVHLIDEKADVFSLGNLLYHVLTTRSPRGKLDKRTRLETVRAVVSKGQPPALHKFYIHSKDPAVIAFKKAMKMCFEFDPKKRASAAEVADVLLDALIEIRAKNPNIGKAAGKH